MPGAVVNESRIGAAPPPRVPWDDPSLHLTAAMTIEAEDTVHILKQKKTPPVDFLLLLSKL